MIRKKNPIAVSTAECSRRHVWTLQNGEIESNNTPLHLPLKHSALCARQPGWEISLYIHPFIHSLTALSNQDELVKPLFFCIKNVLTLYCHRENWPLFGFYIDLAWAGFSFCK